MSKPVLYRRKPVTVVKDDFGSYRVSVELPAYTGWREYNAHLESSRRAARRAVLNHENLVSGTSESKLFSARLSLGTPVGVTDSPESNTVAQVLYVGEVL